MLSISLISVSLFTSHLLTMFTLHYTHFFFFFFFLFLSLNTFTLTSSQQNFVSSNFVPSRISYTQHCAHIVPESNPYDNPSTDVQVPSFYTTYVFNGDQILTPNTQMGQIMAYLSPREVYKTHINGVYKMDSYLVIRALRFNVSRAGTSVKFHLSGFWNSASGHLCMVGHGIKRLYSGKRLELDEFGIKRLPSDKRLELDVVFKANYPSSSNITTSLVTGTLESLNSEVSDSHFKPISFMSFANMNYEYTLIKKEIDSGLETGNTSFLSLQSSFGRCSYFSDVLGKFKLMYKGSCDGRKCSHLDKLFGFLPRFMQFNQIDCSNQRMARVSFGFSNGNDNRDGYYGMPLNISRALVAEGMWNEKRNQFCFVACRILDFKVSPLSFSVGDCSVRVNFTFPASLNIRSTGVVNGHIWSNKSVDETGYFNRTEIRALGSLAGALPEMKYEYTEIKKAKKYCAEKKDLNLKGKSYPNLYARDLKLDMKVRNGNGQSAWGMSHPVFVDSRFVQDSNSYFFSSAIPRNVSSIQVDNSYGDFQNLSYLLRIFPMGEFKVGSEILTENKTMVVSAEGTYDAEVGRICMVGCWNRENDTMDCETFINIQIPSLDSNDSRFVKGTIISKRAKSDPLYFDSLHLSSIFLTKTQVEDAFWRMDIEIIMVLISNTLTCIFAVLQLFHVKKNPSVLPFISLVMLALITLGHMIPLLLNMEALFLSSPGKKTVLFEGDGWLEVNEVLVRVITMLAFLLDFRLLQLTWNAKWQEEGTSKSLWVSEMKVICYSLPIFIGGALIAWFVRGTQTQPLHIYPSSDAPSVPFWHDVKSYAGFVLDAFLMPQILFNVFSNSRDTTLSLPYYVGTTIVRLLPHAYDLFRAHSASWGFDPWYIYANPGMNYYSTTWDILICCLGVLFVAIVYLQQRLGGRSVLPKRFREMIAYEKVPAGL